MSAIETLGQEAGQVAKAAAIPTHAGAAKDGAEKGSNGAAASHLALMIGALALTPAMLLRRRGDALHRRLGWVGAGWAAAVVAMVAMAAETAVVTAAVAAVMAADTAVVAVVAMAAAVVVTVAMAAEIAVVTAAVAAGADTAAETAKEEIVLHGGIIRRSNAGHANPAL